MDTRGALGTAARYGYHGGAGPQVPGYDAGTASAWKLGRLSWGAAGSAGPTAAPAVSWGDFGYGWRGYDGAPSDGAKIGRQVLGATSEHGVLAGLGWTWDYDNAVRLTEAIPGVGDVQGRAPPSGSTADRFTFSYGEGDQLLERLREATGDSEIFESGDYGRITSRDGAAFSYDGVGRRLQDDRFDYEWDWRGQLVAVTVRATWPDGSLSDAEPDGEPDVSPYAGHRIGYEYDANGRLTRRLHDGVADAGGVRPFIEERRFVWEGARLAAEAAYGAPDGTEMRWRRTYVPGPTGLDDPPQVVVEIFQPGSPFSGTARTYTYLRDEQGTVVGLVAEDEGSDPQAPPVPMRYRYTPYGEAHAESRPELLRARFDAEAVEAATMGGTVTQSVADPALAAAGGLVLDWSLTLDPASLDTGLAVEELLPGTGWTPVAAGRAAVGEEPEDPGEIGVASEKPRLIVLLADGWTRGRSYRVRLTSALTDRFGRSFGGDESLEWSVPAPSADPQVPPPAVVYEQRFPTRYASWQAAVDSAGGRFPGGQSRLFQGLWTDPVTGVSYARARWYDARNGVFLTEDPMAEMDSPNLYSFVAWRPSMRSDPLGLASLVIYTTSIKSGDAATFKKAAEKLAAERKAKGQDVILMRVSSGKEIVEAINSQPVGSIDSLDIVSHGNPGGIHIARRITPKDDSVFGKWAHFFTRRNSEHPQSETDAEQMEEEAVGLYTDRMRRFGVAVYYNQDIGDESALLSDIEFDRFKPDCQAEFHGCRTAEDLSLLDSFATQFSQELDEDATVTAHTDPANPAGPKYDYRHGKRVVLKNGKVIRELKGDEQ